MTTLEPIVNQAYLNINGMVCSNDATTPNTKLDVSAGVCRDSGNQMDINLGNYLGVFGSTGANASTVIDFTVNGANGLDTGSIAASKMYFIYVIADPSGYKTTSCIASTTGPATGPIMPFGYGLYRLIGYWPTGGGSTLLKGYMGGASNLLANWRKFMYDAPQASNVTAGGSAVYAAVDFSNIVPLVNNTPVYVQTNWTANAANDTLNLQPVLATGDAVTIAAPVAGATAHTWNINLVLAQISSSKPEINYKVSAGTVAINVAGFDFVV